LLPDVPVNKKKRTFKPKQEGRIKIHRRPGGFVRRR